MQQHDSKYFACRPLLDPGDGFNRSKINFSEHGIDAYQIEENHECSIIIANILPADTRAVQI